MAKLRLFSAYDGKLGTFMPPFHTQHLGQALRSWEDLVSDPQTVLSKHASDFVLYEIGTFDEETGVITAQNPLQQVATALEFKNRPTSPPRSV